VEVPEASVGFSTLINMTVGVGQLGVGPTASTWSFAILLGGFVAAPVITVIFAGRDLRGLGRLDHHDVVVLQAREIRDKQASWASPWLACLPDRPPRVGLAPGAPPATRRSAHCAGSRPPST
jgi:hypothetical protein